MNTLEYIAAVKAKRHITSDYALAKILGVSKSSVFQWNKGICGFNDETARKVAEILDMHPGLVMLDMQRQHARSEETRSAWQEIYQGFLKLLPHARGVMA